MASMAEKYEIELRGRDPATVDSLFLDNSSGDIISGIDDKLTGLLSLSLVNCGLTSFKGLPVLPSVKHIDFTNNKLEGSPDFDVLVANVPELVRLDLSHNNISSPDDLAPLKGLAKLEELSIAHNPRLALTDSNRDKIFHLIPSLKCLDGCDSNGDEVDDDYESGEGEDSESDDDEFLDDEHGGPDLSYLDRSQFSDDETDDYQPHYDVSAEGSSSSGARNNKRNADEASSSKEPDAKKMSSEK